METDFLVGTYTDDTDSQGIYALHLDAHGHPSVDLDTPILMRNPSFLIQHPFLDVVYVVSEVGEATGGEVAVMRRGAKDQFEIVQTLPSGGMDPCHLAVSPQGRWLLASHYSSGTVSLFSLGSDGGLISRGHCVDHRNRWVNRPGKAQSHPRQNASHVHSTQFIDDQQFLVCDLGTDEVVVYDLSATDPAQGELRYVWNFPSGSGPRHAVVRKEPLRIYVVCELSNRVAILGLGSQGMPVTYDARSCLTAQSTFNEASEIRFDAHGYLWVGNRGDDSLARFSLASDNLSDPQIFRDCGRYPRHFWMDGWHLLVAGRDDNCVRVARMTRDGRPNLSDALSAEVPAPVCILPIRTV